jgi:hypothetical protein
MLEHYTLKRVFNETMQHLCNKPYNDLAGISKQKYCNAIPKTVVLNTQISASI